MEIYNDLLEYCEALGMHLKRSGTRYVANCPLPMHNGTDTNPSFTVYPNQTFYCFGCLNSGDATELARFLGIEPPVILRKKTRKTVQKYFDPNEAQIELMTRFVDIYSGYIPKSIRKYLNVCRGFTDEEIEVFKIGYCTGRRFYLKLAERKLAYLLGIVNFLGWEKFGSRIIIPEMRNDKVIWFQGRTITEEHPLKYLNVKLSPPLFGIESCTGSKYVWVTEGTIDALSLITAGEPAVALIGAFLANRHKDFFFGRIVKICLDSDDAGRMAVGKLKSQLKGIAMITVDVRLPEGIKDVAELKAKGELEKWLKQ